MNAYPAPAAETHQQLGQEEAWQTDPRHCAAADGSAGLVEGLTGIDRWEEAESTLSICCGKVNCLAMSGYILGIYETLSELRDSKTHAVET